MRPAEKKGIILAVLVITLTFTALTVFAVTLLVMQTVRRNEVIQRRMRCFYAAYAGVSGALYECRRQSLSSGGISLPQLTYVDPQTYYVLEEKQADLLLVDARNAAVGSSSSARNRIRNIILVDPVSSAQIVVEQITLTWNNSRRLRQIVVAGRNVWTGKASSPAACDIKSFIVKGKGTTIDYLLFDGDMRNSSVSVKFLLADGSSREKKVYPASADMVFTLRVKGRIEGDSLSRCLAADYDFVSEVLTGLSEVKDD